jgi:hypothetical protein
MEMKRNKEKPIYAKLALITGVFTSSGVSFP